MRTPAPPAVVTALYDADCGICQRSARWVRRLDRRGRVETVPLQMVESGDLPAGVTPDDLLERMHTLEVGSEGEGEVTVGWDAVVRIVRELPLLRWLTPLDRMAPLHRLGHRLYDRVAEGRDRTCPMPGR